MLATDDATNTVTIGSRDELARTAITVRDAPPASARGAGRQGPGPLPLAPACCAVAPVAPGEHEELELELAEPAYGVAPGQTACLLAGDVVVGRATIA